jgi:hypothetical protein
MWLYHRLSHINIVFILVKYSHVTKPVNQSISTIQPFA